MTRKIAVVAIILVFILGVSAFAADQNFGAGKTRNVTFNNDVKVGDKVLAAGEYRVLHLMEGNEHTLVFKSMSDKEKVRVKCTMVDMGKKAEASAAEYKTIGNERILTGLIFRGDSFRHAL